MADEQNKIETPASEVKASAWESFRGFVKKNKGKIITGFTLLVGYIAGDNVGVFDIIKGYFGF